ncbi:serine proteinase stubble isoform X2 [Pieris napi]|uniref:serine proteinase stubble isoform X2 n=1 Tax=Pieris napi TaxID=78633 RepID=UPI001FBAD03C|nr:serine proteinase stubble isoform X2 [Pieris napi]
MGPPINTWPYSHPKFNTSEEKKCLIHTLIDSVRSVSINCTVVVVLVQLLYSLTYVTAGPVILSLDYLQAPVPLARNIRHLPCVSRRTGEEGLCMFAIDCLKSNGSHLGTCIDRFYFGSCCQIPDKNILPSIINNIEDNTIDSSNFVHPQEDKIINHLYKKPTSTTNKPSSLHVPTETTESAQDRTASYEDHNLDKITTIDNTIGDKTTTSSTESMKTSQKIIPTEVPIKISTFQSVSSDTNYLTSPKPVKVDTTEAITTEKPKPPRKPSRPTYKPRPTYRPTNFTRPSYTGTGKPRPTKPISTVIPTRKPPFRVPSKRPPTKKPIQIPPRLNITILPQSTSSRPAFSRPSGPSIIYINHTLSKLEENTLPTVFNNTSSTTPSTTATEPSTTTSAPSTTVSSSTSPSTTTVTTTTTTTPVPTTTTPARTTTTPAPTTTTPAPTTTTPATTTTTPAPTTTEKQRTEAITETLAIETESILQTETLSTTEPSKVELTTEISKETEIETTIGITEPITIAETTDFKDITTQALTERETIRTTEVEITTTDFPPFVTWSSNVNTATKTPEKPTTEAEEGWVLLTTSKPETTSTTTTTTSTETTTAEQLPTVITTESTRAPSISSVETTQSTTTTTTTTSTSTSAQQIPEFIVNVTLSPTVPTTTESLKDNVTSSENSTNAVDVNEVTTATIEMAYNMSNFKDVCGRRMWPQARIVGGAKSSFGEWPWQISLRQYRTSTYLHKCGAALLNENWAITAAHCVEHVPPSELLVRLGEHDLATEDEPYGFAERRVQIIASHPHFDPATFEYDLALLRFYEPVTFQPNILPICVPDNDDDYVGKTAYVTGWGRLYDEGPLPSVLQEVQVPIINNTACESMYQSAGYNEHIPNIFICAGWKNGGSDSCEGDSGGPMVIQRDRDNRYVLGGIISWGIGCAEPNQPGVYTRISEFRDWINQILQF